MKNNINKKPRLKKIDIPESEKEYEVEKQFIVDGNTVREVEVSPPQKKKKNKSSEAEAARSNRNVKRNRERALAMDLPYLIMLSIAAIIAFAICANYISVQSRLTSTIKTTQKNESKLETLKNENDALENVIVTYVDLDHVYDVAVNRLGMIYARKNQVITYEKTENEYVRQFEDIPQEKD